MTSLEIPKIIKCPGGFILKTVSLKDTVSFLDVIKSSHDYFKQFDFISPNFQTEQEVRDVIESLITYKKQKTWISEKL